jgi:hypothetical protein
LAIRRLDAIIINASMQNPPMIFPRIARATDRGLFSDSMQQCEIPAIGLSGTKKRICP